MSRRQRRERELHAVLVAHLVQVKLLRPLRIVGQGLVIKFNGQPPVRFFSRNATSTRSKRT